MKPVCWKIERKNVLLSIGLVIGLIIVYFIAARRNVEPFGLLPEVSAVCKTMDKPTTPIKTSPSRPLATPSPVPTPTPTFKPAPTQIKVNCNIGLNLAPPPPPVNNAIKELSTTLNTQPIKDKLMATPELKGLVTPESAELITLIANISQQTAEELNITEEQRVQLAQQTLSVLNTNNPVLSQLVNKCVSGAEDNLLCPIINSHEPEPMKVIADTIDTTGEITQEQAEKNKAFIFDMENRGLVTVSSELCYQFLTGGT